MLNEVDNSLGEFTGDVGEFIATIETINNQCYLLDDSDNP